MPGPIAFAVMPFDIKKTQLVEAPTDVDFDALWERVHEPALGSLGYRPVRADQDVGASIIGEMIQRLTLADLVVADVSLPNPNVYYEIGIRHAAKKLGCVLIAADWAKPVFDIRQMRQLRYPLPDGTVGEEATRAARAVLVAKLQPLTAGISPVFDAVPGFPDRIDPLRLSAFQDVVTELSEFDAQVRSVRLLPAGARASRVRQIIDDHGHTPVVREAVVLQLLRLLRDHVGWSDVLDYIAELPEHMARHPLVVEQRSLALGKAGDAAMAAMLLEKLIEEDGATSERYGLLGGRYKELLRMATSAADQRRYLNAAIDRYRSGMVADLNDYYPSSNLARLYRRRGADGDEQRAQEAQMVTAVACRRAIEHGTADEWARPTLLGVAFDQGDITEAERLLPQVEEEGAERWKLTTTLDDLRVSAEHQSDPQVRRRLTAVLDQLAALHHCSGSDD